MASNIARSKARNGGSPNTARKRETFQGLGTSASLDIPSKSRKGPLLRSPPTYLQG